MNVVPFPLLTGRLDRGWHQIELQQLVALYSAQAQAGRVESWDVDMTEASDPQFYLLGPSPEQDCVACISRVGRIYVLEDGSGALVDEDRSLNVVIARAGGLLSPRKGAGVLARVTLMLCAIRAMIDEKLEPLIPDTAETLEGVVPVLAAIV